MKLPHEVNEFLSMVASGPQLGKTYMSELNRFIAKAKWVKANFKKTELPDQVSELVEMVSNGPEWGTSINHSINLYMKTAIQLRSNYSGKSQKVAPLEPEPIWNGESAMNKENVDTLELGMDAVKWAQEFNRVSSRLGYSKMDEAWLIGWFANAIMSGYDTARNRYDPEVRAALGVDEPAKPE